MKIHSRPFRLCEPLNGLDHLKGPPQEKRRGNVHRFNNNKKKNNSTYLRSENKNKKVYPEDCK